DSGIRRQAQIDISRRDFHQQAVIATVKPARNHQHTAWQKFLPGGPIAFLPLADGYCSIVWSTGIEHAGQLVNQSDADFRRELGDVIDGKLGVITDSSARFSFPLFQQQARRYVGNRIALIGDAAHRIHPLAGMGANLGIADALTLAELLADQTGDPGSPELLNRYDRWRRSEVNAYMTAQEMLRSCYRWSVRPATDVRGLGVSMLNKSVIVKPELLLRTIGLTGNLPRLMQPMTSA
ncbi:MAG: 2-octaprenyl-3-methyl-6-methoxy-1,4-benzoquinol hydroxylase, partial [Gammaproteobacteria bacterium]